jgi:hypothetical protein
MKCGSSNKKENRLLHRQLTARREQLQRLPQGPAVLSILIEQMQTGYMGKR